MLIVCGTLTGCSPSEPVSRDGFFFDTFIRISIYEAPDRRAALDRAFELCDYYDVLFSKDRAGSDILKINSAGAEPVTVSPETIELLQLGSYYSELSDGRFDVTCGRVTDLWDFGSEQPSLPDGAELAAALSTVGWRGLEIDRDDLTVRCPEGALIDVGGIAKGFIADRIRDELRSMGCGGAVINLGGNVYALGSKRGKPFTVGVQSPYDTDGFIGTVSVSDRSVVTAGSYQRCFTLDGRLYHHILDLSDGMPADTGIASVTVISESSADGDAIATICFLLGETDAEAFLDGLDIQIEAYFALSDGNVHHYCNT